MILFNTIIGVGFVSVLGLVGFIKFKDWSNRRRAKQVFFALYDNFDALLKQQKTHLQLDSFEVMTEQMIALNDKYKFIK